jgi:hypothetical protein
MRRSYRVRFKPVLVPIEPPKIPTDWFISRAVLQSDLVL